MTLDELEEGNLVMACELGIINFSQFIKLWKQLKERQSK